MSKIIEQYLGISERIQENIIITLVIIIIIWFIDRLILKFFIHKIEDAVFRYQWTKILKYVSFFIALMFLSRVWFGIFGSLGTYFGLLSAGLAIALKDLLVNLVGWFFILIRKPFKIGDRVEINGIIGDVIDLRIFQFSVSEVGNWVDADQSTGRIIHIPNGTVFSHPQANYTAGFEYIWNEIPVLVTFESDWKKAKKILTDIINNYAIKLSEDAEKQIKEAAKKYLIFFTELTPIVYTAVKDSGVLLTMRYLCRVRSRRSTEEAIWEETLDKFSKCPDIDFAYPTQRFYNNITEGKSEARADQ